MIELYDYQKETVAALEPVLRSQPLTIVNADVGTGKTIMALDLARRLSPPAVGVLAPKIVLSAWERAARDMGVKLAFCINPEIVRTGRRPAIATKQKDGLYFFQLPPESVVIFDELHRYGAPDSQLARMLLGARASRCKVLGATGTLGDSILRFRGMLAVCGLVPWHNFYRWAMDHGCWRDKNINGNPWRFVKGPAAARYMGELHGMLFPTFGTRLSVRDIPGYPECQTQVDLYDMSEKQQDRIADLYAEMRVEIRHPERAKTELTRLLRLRQLVQSEKAVLFADITEELVAEGNSVAAFFDFTEPLHTYAKLVKEALGVDVPLIWGEQSRAERDEAVRKFQANEVPVIALNSEAGGVGVNLGDEHGGHPRVGLHNLPLSGETLLQAGGRIWRATNKTKALNKIVLVDGVEVEERVYGLLKRKLRNLATVQGDDIEQCLL